MSATPETDSRPARTRDRPVCRHCGSPLLDERARETGFCCAGCAYVHRLIHKGGFDAYYRFKDTVTPPADASLFQPRDTTWLARAQEAAEKAEAARGEDRRHPELSLSIQGISCAGCVWLIERLYQQHPGARDSVVNAQTGEMRLRWDAGACDLPAFAAKLQSFGYLLGPAGGVGDNSESRDLVRRIGLCGAFAMNVMLFTLPTYFGMKPSFEYARLFGAISFGCGTLSLLVGGSHFLGRAVRSLREGALHIDLPIALGILGAYAGSTYGFVAGVDRFVYFDFLSVFILLMLIGRWAQVAAVEKNQRRLLAQQVKPASLRTFSEDGGSAEVSPEQIRTGQQYLLANGQTSPVESRLESADCAFSLSSINGESEPRIYRQGEVVPAGALNVSRADARLCARQVWDDSLLAKLVGPGERLGWRHRFLERIIRGYLVGILVIAALAGIAWGIATRDALRTGAVVTAVLVVSCPCAIGLAFPLADEMAAVALRRRGVFVRENDLWAKLRRVRRIVFDKTGTLTLETPELENPEALSALAGEARAALHAMVRNNAHPISQTLLAELLAIGAPEPATGQADEEVGQGVSLHDACGVVWRLGRPSWALAGPETADSAAGEVIFARNGAQLAQFRFADRARADATGELAQLSAHGFETWILSGDHPEKVRRLATELGIPPSRALGGRSPEDKASWISESGSDDTLMLGDGANDSLAFDKAFCRGTPVVHRGLLERKADFYYLGRGIGGIRALFDVDRIRHRTQLIILSFSVVYNLLAVGLAVSGLMDPLVAAILMPANSLATLLIVSIGMKPAFSIA